MSSSTPVNRLRRTALANSTVNQYGSPLNSPSSHSSSASSQTSYHTPIRRPLANSGGPSSASRGSSTVPFDVEGNRRAAKLAMETPPKPRTVAVGGSRGKPFIRKRPLMDRITDLPHTLLSKLELDVDFTAMARPAGLALTGLHFLLRAPLWTTSSSSGKQERTIRNVLRKEGSSTRFEGRWDVSPKAPGVFSLRWTLILSILLILAASLNAFYMYTRTRSYRMHLRTDPLSSPNARAVKEEEPLEEPIAGDFRSAWAWSRHNLSPVPFFRFLLSLPPKSSSSKRRHRVVQQLDVWFPPAFNLQLYSTYTPASALVLHFLTPSAPFIALAVALAVSFQSHSLVGKYDALMKDRALLNAEVLHEYDQKFVYPSLFKHRKDASTTTNEAEMVW